MANFTREILESDNNLKIETRRGRTIEYTQQALDKMDRLGNIVKEITAETGALLEIFGFGITEKTETGITIIDFMIPEKIVNALSDNFSEEEPFDIRISSAKVEINPDYYEK